ncbi:MAG: hypothetical protein LBH25_04805 [Fibromonadaceae bacterium]|jgi:hypothetical protein|nr:hypothetical protein [Fibromonadaceae bacterium]
MKRYFSLALLAVLAAFLAFLAACGDAEIEPWDFNDYMAATEGQGDALDDFIKNWIEECSGEDPDPDKCGPSKGGGGDGTSSNSNGGDTSSNSNGGGDDNSSASAGGGDGNSSSSRSNSSSSMGGSGTGSSSSRSNSSSSTGGGGTSSSSNGGTPSSNSGGGNCASVQDWPLNWSQPPVCFTASSTVCENKNSKPTKPTVACGNNACSVKIGDVTWTGASWENKSWEKEDIANKEVTFSGTFNGVECKEPQ